MERVSCLRSGAYNIEVAPRFLENFCTPDIAYCVAKNHPLVTKTVVMNVVLIEPCLHLNLWFSET
jgi:hypothetical protein